MTVEQGKLADVSGLIPSRLPCPVEGNASLHFRREACLANHAKTRIDSALVPIVIRVFVFLLLSDYQPIVDNGLIRMSDKILDGGIDRSSMVQVFLNTFHIKID